MARYNLRGARIIAFVHQCPHGEPGSVEVVVRKAWWHGPGRNSEGRELHRFCIPLPDGEEAERVARGLEAAAAAIRG